MIVEMYMSRDVEVISPDATLIEGIRRMTQRRIRRLVVTQGSTVVGIVCHRDIVGAFPRHINPFSAIGIEEHPLPGAIASVMKRPVVTVERDQPIEAAAALMTRHHVGGLPVIQRHQLVGIITESDIFRAFSALLSANDESVRITFDITEDTQALTFLVETARAHALDLQSFITFPIDNRWLAVARIRGQQTTQLIEKLWNSGHSVLNVVRP